MQCRKAVLWYVSAVLVILWASFSVTNAKATVLEVWFGESGTTYEQVFRELAAEFEEQTPGITLTIRFLGGPTSWPDKLLAAIVGGVPPDVAYFEASTAQEFRAAGLLMPLNGVLKDLAPDALNPGSWVPNAVLEYSYKGVWYGVPFRTDIRGLYVNIDHLQNAGVDPYLAPTTIDDLDAIARKATVQRGSEEPEILGFFPFGNNIPELQWMLAFGGEIVDWKTLRTTLRQFPQNELALEWMLDYADRYGPKRRPSHNLFEQGKLSMEVNSTTVLAKLPETAPGLDWWVHPMPYQSNGRNPTSSSIHGPVIPSGTKNIDAAAHFLAYLARPEVQLKWYRGTQSMPASTIALRRAIAEMKDPREIKLVRQWPETNPRPPLWRVLVNTVRNGVERLLNRQITPGQFIDEMQREFDAEHQKVFSE